MTALGCSQPPGNSNVLLVIGIALILAHFLTAGGLTPWYVVIFLVGLLQQVLIAALNSCRLDVRILDDPAENQYPNRSHCAGCISKRLITGVIVAAKRHGQLRLRDQTGRAGHIGAGLLVL